MRKIIRKICKKRIKAIARHDLENDDGITNRISFGGSGLCRYEVTFSDGEARTFVVKRKSRNIILKGLRILGGNDLALILKLAAHHKVLGYNKSYLRETELYNNLDDKLKNYLIPMYGYYHNRLTDKHVMLLKYVDAPTDVTACDYRLAFDAATDFYKAYYEQREKVEKPGANIYGASDYKKCKIALVKMFERLDGDNLKVFGQTKTDAIKKFLQNIDGEFIPYHRTLTHNDFSPRNMFFDGGRLYIYDWELACYQHPEHDLTEFLVSVMHEVSDDEVFEMIEYFKQTLFEKLGKQTDESTYARILRFNVLEYAGIRLTMLRLVNLRFRLPFTDGMTENMSRLMDLLHI